MTGAHSGATRFDIQFMRGVAVLLVVLYHGLGSAVARGFLGVDVFFVLSGYLITAIVLRDLENGRFSFRAFYLRRAKRLLPAAYSTFLVTTLLGYLLLTRPQWSMYLLQLGGGVSFTANMVLWLQADYFAPAAEAKPLLHIWSLSLEEQFYFLMPLMLWIVPLRSRLWLIAGGFLLSLALCVAASGLAEYQSFAFFMLPTRAWELFAGSICAWLVLRRGAFRFSGFVPWLCLGAILATCTIGFDPVHPRGDAIIVVAATAVLILGGDGWLPANAMSKAIATVGDWSYSLYLVHWPLFSFAHIAYLGEPPLPIVLGLILLSFVLAWLQYRFVETPFRYAWPVASRKAWASFAAMTAGLVLSAAPAAAFRAGGTRSPATNIGLATECRQQGGSWTDLPGCRTSDAPRIAIWGDSNAIHLVPALRHLPIVQMTKVACAPVPGIAQFDADYSPDWARSCIAFSNSAFGHLLANRHIRQVVIASPFFSILVDEGQSLIIGGRQASWSMSGRDLLIDSIRRLRAAGKNVILVAPLPRGGFDPGMCHERTTAGVLVAGRSGCDFTAAEMSQGYLTVRSELRAVARRTGAVLIEPERAICSEGRCRTSIAGRTLYRDEGHLTPEGAAFVARRTGLLQLLGAAKGDGD